MTLHYLGEAKRFSSWRVWDILWDFQVLVAAIEYISLHWVSECGLKLKIINTVSNMRISSFFQEYKEPKRPRCSIFVSFSSEGGIRDWGVLDQVLVLEYFSEDWILLILSKHLYRALLNIQVWVHLRVWYITLTCDEPDGCCWQIYPAVGKINKTIPETSVAWV